MSRLTGRNHLADVLQQALDAISGGMSVKKASVVYKIPRPTLRRHRDSRVKCPGKVNLGSFKPVLGMHAV